MKPATSSHYTGARAALVASLLAAIAAPASASVLYWTGPSTAGTASTYWSTTNNIWGTTTGTGGTSAPGTTAFTSADTATFEGTAATVRLGSDVTAAGIALGGYTIDLNNGAGTPTAYNLTLAGDLTGNGTVTNSGSTFKTFTWQPTTDYSGNLTINGRTALVFNAASASTTALVTFSNNVSASSTTNLTITQGTVKLAANSTTASGVNASIAANGKLDVNGFNFAYRTLSGTGELTNSSGTAATLTARPASSNFAGLITGKITLSTADLGSSTFTGAINNVDLNITSVGQTSSGTANSNITFSNATRIGNTTLGNTVNSGSSTNRAFHMVFLNADNATAGTVGLTASANVTSTSGAAQSNSAFVAGGNNATLGNVTFTTNATSAASSSAVVTTASGTAWLRLAGNNATVGNITMNGSYSVGSSGATQQTASARVEVLGATATVGNLVSSTANATNISKLVVLGNPTAGTATTLTLNTTANSAFDGVITDATVTASNATLSGITSGFVNQGTATTNAGAVGNLVKSGSFTQTLSGVNTYTGSTTISAGGLTISGSGSINSSSGVSVANGATFTNNSSVAFTKALTVNEGANLAGTGTFTPASMIVLADLTGGSFSGVNLASGTLTRANGLTFTLSNIEATSFSVFTGAGTVGGSFASVSVGATALSSSDGGLTFTGSDGLWNYTFTNSGSQLQISAIPEPSAFAALAGLGALGFAGLRRRRRA